ncbi:MAG: MarR family transcriptional regulator [Alphaproteobacteria bacterium]|nr:MarR family transcriptional regulator [Alphaproteobacteria bacterium]
MAELDDNTRLYFRFFTEIGIIAQLSQNWLERALPEGMSLAQFGVLNHVVRTGSPSSPGRLARNFQITKGAMTNTLQRLEAQGYIRITPDPDDARAKLVDITDAGRKAREEAIAATAEAMSDLPERFPVTSVHEALPTLEHVRQLLDERR